MTLRTKIEEAIEGILAYDPLHKDERQGGYTGHSNCDIDYPRARKELADQICTIFKEELIEIVFGDNELKDRGERLLALINSLEEGKVE